MNRPLLIAATLALSSGLPALASGQESWVGKTVIVKKHLIPIGYVDGEGRQVNLGVLDNLDYQVLGDENGWLKVCNRHGIRGWFSKDDAVLASEAVEYFTRVIQQNPGNTLGYNHRAWAWQLKGELEIAIGDWNEAIRLDPAGSAVAYNNRGIARLGQKDYDKALADFNEAIRLEQREIYFNNRGIAWAGKKEYQRAIADYNEALRLDPKYVNCWSNRGRAWGKQGMFDKAIRDYKQAIELDSQGASAHNSLAWLLATCPESKHRDGTAAVEHAQRACDLTGWKVANYVDTLAAAHAQMQQFDLAVRYQQDALRDSGLAGASGAGARERLQLYEQKKPYRE